MLAKENKIKTLLKQRSFIEKGLSLIPEGEDGEPSFRYIGYLYAENRDYFYQQGYRAEKVTDGTVLMATKGFPIWIFVPRDDAEMLLSEEEMEEAKKYLSSVAISEEEVEKHAETIADAIMASIFRGAHTMRTTPAQAAETATFLESLLNGRFPRNDDEMMRAAEAVGESFLNDFEDDDDSDFDEEDF